MKSNIEELTIIIIKNFEIFFGFKILPFFFNEFDACINKLILHIAISQIFGTLRSVVPIRIIKKGINASIFI